MRIHKRMVVVVLALEILFASLAGSLMPGYSHAVACEGEFYPKYKSDLARQREKDQATRFGRTYFTYTKLAGDGTLWNVIENLPLYKKMGIENLWISPVYPQTVMEMPYVDEHGTPQVTINTHYYWPEDPGSIAAELGGEKNIPGVEPADRGTFAFKELVRRAKDLGITIIFDAVFDHGGYAESFHMNFEREDGSKVNKIIYSNDRTYFRANFDGPYLLSRYKLLDAAPSKELARAYMKEIASLQWDQWLPVYNHENEEIFQWLYHSHRKFIDMGIESMRIDAFKHMPLHFLVRMVNALGEYSQRKYNRRMTFLAEHLITSENYIPIQAVTEIFDREVIWANVNFIDFPKAYTARRLAYDPYYKMKDFARFIRYRYDPAHNKLLSQLVSDVENHDFLFPVSSSQFNRMLVFAVSEFFSYGGTILFHGGESISRTGDARVRVPEVTEDGDVGEMLEYWHRLLAPMRAPATKTTFILDNEDEKMIAEHSLGLESFILLVSRTSLQENIQYVQSKLADENPDASIAYDVVYVYSSGLEGRGINSIDLRPSGAVDQQGYQNLEIRPQHSVDITTYGQTVALIRARVVRKSVH